jgi:hypothetical protein
MITQIDFNDFNDTKYYSDNNTFWRTKEPQNVNQYCYLYESENIEFYIKSVKTEITEEEALEIFKQDAKFYRGFDSLEELIQEAIDCGSYITDNMKAGWNYFNKINNEYLIHDNGGRPFNAVINFDKKTIKVYKFDADEVDDNTEDEEIKYNVLVYETDFINLFVGKTNEFYDEEYEEYYQFRGNSILVQTEELKYTFIGLSIYSFTSLETIEKYFSPIGNSDVPYPYAIDINQNIYLMIENIIIIPENNTFEYLKEKNICPYQFYYYNNLRELYGYDAGYDNNLKFEIDKFEETEIVKRL